MIYKLVHNSIRSMPNSFTVPTIQTGNKSQYFIRELATPLSPPPQHVNMSPTPKTSAHGNIIIDDVCELNICLLNLELGLCPVPIS